MVELTWKYVKQVKDKESLENLEQQFNFILPNDIKTYIMEYNGGRPNKKVFDTYNSKDKEVKSLLSINKEDIENIYDVMDVMGKIYKNIVPIMSDPGGNYICYEMENEKIVYWDHETNKIEFVASSFTQFLELLR